MAVVSFTVLAGPGQITFFGIRKRLSIIYSINPHPGNAEQFIRFVLPKWYIIFRHTGNHAGAATGTLVQIDDHSELFAIFVFHQYSIEMIFSSNIQSSYVRLSFARIPQAASKPVAGSGVLWVSAL
jgi:hypothetical protein